MEKLRRFSLPLIALGKRSLTFFVWKETLLVLLLSPVALNLGRHVNNGVAALIAIGVWILSVILASLLERNKMNGPLEVLMRKFVYKK